MKMPVRLTDWHYPTGRLFYWPNLLARRADATLLPAGGDGHGEASPRTDHEFEAPAVGQARKAIVGLDG